jgi:hypothetical protein
LFNEKSLFRTLLDSHREKKGVALAKDEVQRYALGHDVKGIKSERLRLFNQNHGMISNSPFYHGWLSVWFSHGARDARSGSCRAAIYENVSYNRGWCQTVYDMQQCGWSHPRLGPEYEEVLKQIGEFGSKEFTP